MFKLQWAEKLPSINPPSRLEYIESSCRELRLVPIGRSYTLTDDPVVTLMPSVEVSLVSLFDPWGTGRYYKTANCGEILSFPTKWSGDRATFYYKQSRADIKKIAFIPGVEVTDSSGASIAVEVPTLNLESRMGAAVVSTFDRTRQSDIDTGSEGLAVDTSGNVYVAETGNHLIRKITFE